MAVDDSCLDSPVGGGEELSAQFDESNADTVTVGFGKGATVSGELYTNAGDPVPGATLCVKMATLGIDQQASSAGIVKARKVRYFAHPKPSLRAKLAKLGNGERVRFSGQVPGPGNGGRVVIVQANVVGSKRWITFRRRRRASGAGSTRAITSPRQREGPSIGSGRWCRRRRAIHGSKARAAQSGCWCGRRPFSVSRRPDASGGK